jgi:hypothetical protein
MTSDARSIGSKHRRAVLRLLIRHSPPPAQIHMHVSRTLCATGGLCVI